MAWFWMPAFKKRHSMSKPIIRPVVTSKKRQRLLAIERTGVSVENQSAAIPKFRGQHT